MAKKKNKKANAAANTTPAPQTTMESTTAALSQTTLSDNVPALAPPRPQTFPRLNKGNIAQEFDRYFGAGGLADWQRLCRDVGIEKDLRTLTQCRKALKDVWVNIYDLLHAVRENRCPPRRFESEQALAKYTKKKKKIYPKRKAKEEGPIRDLLAHIF